MSKLIKPAQAGTVESSDILIVLAPAEPGTGITIELVSPVIKQYGEHIRSMIVKTLNAHGIVDAHVHANDKGALDYTIEARVTAAVKRALN
ncbi:citrate lyase acyl carrier protein [Sporolituus thermophilus]|uniref:Citrate lyase subunit gamma (Acyl carrier protein) n=1 Tax=Sporolituus thermophilus DSM 23256 TaxID=1123285 RepID=A0A1G7KI17_9FIRM|nr:citrate lyase acyl carrier protein [Sporolituus thermophilus]SDF36674.1 citrate lyase subunit gamma (acyl carrier protein) [Sporolituus thermophilus DSM 23256]